MYHIRHGLALLALERTEQGIAAVQRGLPIVRAAGIQLWVDRGEEALRAAGGTQGD